VLHVDDGLMGGRHTQRYYDELAAKYEMKNLGCPDTFLGMEYFTCLAAVFSFTRLSTSRIC
jgi:hypothetical protein